MITPGPWIVSVRDDDTCDVYHEDHGTIATLHDPIGVELQLVDIVANAELIAAAPALLEALEALLRADEFLSIGSTIGIRVDAMQAARAAISKARGES